jgi:hypothetical protein
MRRFFTNFKRGNDMRLREVAEELEGPFQLDWESIIMLIVDLIGGCMANENKFAAKGEAELGQTWADRVALRLRVNDLLREQGVRGRSRPAARALLRQYRSMTADDLRECHQEAMAIGGLNYNADDDSFVTGPE